MRCFLLVFRKMFVTSERVECLCWLETKFPVRARPSQTSVLRFLVLLEAMKPPEFMTRWKIFPLLYLITAERNHVCPSEGQRLGLRTPQRYTPDQIPPGVKIKIPSLSSRPLSPLLLGARGN